MKLQSRFITQSIIVFLSTVLITTCLSVLFVDIYLKGNDVKISNGAVKSHVLVMKNDNIVYQSMNMDAINIQKMIAETNYGEGIIEYYDSTYNVSHEQSVNALGEKYDIYTLEPIVDIDRSYKVMVTFIICTFVIVYIIATIISQRYNFKTIINPVKKLRDDTEDLSDGNLDIEIAEDGYGEIRELTREIEKLRLKLKESAFYRNKYDDNRKFLISSISHDLKTPVTAVRGYIEGVLDGVADTDDKKYRYLSSALAKTELISNMIGDLLLYSKLDLNQVTFDTEKTDIVKFISDITDDNVITFEKEGKEITFHFSEEIRGLNVNIDQNRFRRVFQNILDNALKNTDAGVGRIDIRLRQTGTSVIIEFKDNGVGIDKDELPYIFDRFFRTDSARKIEGSSGLGLAIAKQIVEGHGGKIWAVSEKGEGTSIMVSLRKAGL